MISDKINSVLEFIDFLHDNTEDFKKYLPQAEKVQQIDSEIETLEKIKGLSGFEKKVKIDSLKETYHPEYSALNNSVSEIIIDKALGCGVIEKPTFENAFWIDLNEGLEQEIKSQLKRFEKGDDKIIVDRKTKYVDFRVFYEQFNSKLICHKIFSGLDEHLFNLFVFFEDFEQDLKNQFEPFSPNVLAYSSREGVNELHRIFGTKSKNEKTKESIEELDNDTPKIYENRHPDYFVDGAFEIFEKWMSKSQLQEDKRISFIYQKLKEEEKLRITDFNRFSKWAYDNEFIGEYFYKILSEKKHFIQPSKILTERNLDFYKLMFD